MGTGPTDAGLGRERYWRIADTSPVSMTRLNLTQLWLKGGT